MLHLIWTKDNTGTTSEEDKELKGIRQRLIECYRALYFDPIEDLDPRQQTNRVAKSMIEYVISYSCEGATMGLTFYFVA